MEKTKINVIDALMGKGKTSWAIQCMNEAEKDEKFIFITLFLDEVDRIKNGVTSREMTSPENKKGTKKKDFKQLLAMEKNIVTTHALFKKIDTETIDLIRMGKYTLILDEAMDVLDEIKVTGADYDTLFDKYMEYNKETSVCKWVYEGYSGLFEQYQRMAETGNLLHFGKKLLFWTFPVQNFLAFDNVYVLTYLFDGQILRYYYDMHKVVYTKLGIENVGGRYTLTEYNGLSEQDRAILKGLIHIHESSWNDVGRSRGKGSPLSTNYLGKAGDIVLNKIGNTALQFYRTTTRELDVGSEAVMWTCVEDFRNKLGKKGFKKQFIAINAKATNQYQDKAICIYLSNIFMRPPVLQIFRTRGIKVNEELYALSELLQWLFRSRIRKGEYVELFMPSDRMRRILQEYLGY